MYLFYTYFDIIAFKLEKALVLSYALLSCRFAVNILLPVREPLSGFTQRVFGKTEKTIQLSPFSGEKGTAPILPVAIYQIEKKTFRAVKSGKHFFSFLFLPPLPPFFFFFKGLLLCGSKSPSFCRLGKKLGLFTLTSKW